MVNDYRQYYYFYAFKNQQTLMNKFKLISILLIIFLVEDLTYSFFQYYNTPLFGDITVSVLPEVHVQKLFNDPFGFDIIKNGKKQFNPNRYFSHLFLQNYFRKMPLFLQKFVSPINSVYLSAAIAKSLCFQ